MEEEEENIVPIKRWKSLDQLDRVEKKKVDLKIDDDPEFDFGQLFIEPEEQGSWASIIGVVSVVLNLLVIILVIWRT